MMIAPVDPAGEYRVLATEIDDAVRGVLSSGQFVAGAEVAAFEREFADYVDTAHVVGVGNGTDALEIALAACGVECGDSVAVPAFTFAATVEAVVRVGATPLLIDIVDSDFAIDVRALAERLAKGAKVKAVIPVHLYGHPADMEALLELRERYGLTVIEDAAQSHGARCRIAGESRRVGGLGDAACFSFYPTKNLGAAGDGGAIATSNAEIAARARLIANHGDASKYEHVLADGRNSRLDAIQAAILRIKLRRLDEWNDARRRIAGSYTANLAPAAVGLPKVRAGAESVYHQFAVRVSERDRTQAVLRELGVAAGVHYPRAIHQQPGFARFAESGESYPCAERAAAEILCLPIYPLMTDETREAVERALVQALEQG